MSDIRKLMDATKGYSEVSQEVQEGWLKDTFDKVVDTLGLGPAERNKVTDAAETKTTEIEKIEAEVQAKLNSAANDTYQNDKIDDIANASDAEAKANADAAITKKMDQDNAADAPGNSGAAATTGNKTAKEVWDEIKAKRDPLPQGPERTRLSNLMNDINVSPNSGTSPEDAAKILAQAANRPSDAELDANTVAATDTNTNTTFDSINDAQNADNLKAGDIITIDGKEAEVGETNDGQQFFVHPGSDIPIDKPAPPAPQGELSATDTAQTATKTATADPDANDPRGDQTNPPPAATADPDANDPRGDQTNPPPAAAASNGSLLGRKLDTTTPNIMKAYNDGGKQAMPTIRNMQTALSRLGFDPNGIDGKYGNGTFKAVQAFQKANGLAVDGQAGPDTMKSMKAILDKNFEKNKVTPADTANSTAPRSNASGDPAETGSTGVPPKANSAVNTTGPAATTQFASKDNNMKKAIKESASMNVSMTADNASEVADLMKLLKNAGMDDAKPVGDIMSPPMSPMEPSMEPSMPSDNMSDFVKMVDKGEKQDLPGETSCSSCGGTHEEDSCSEEYDAVIDEWDNSPEEEYKDANYMLNDLAGGINRPKKHRAAAGGDNAMAVEASIKEQLWAALNEKKADIKTTEGRGKVMAGRGRGKDKLMAGRGRGKKK